MASVITIPKSISRLHLICRALFYNTKKCRCITFDEAHFKPILISNKRLSGCVIFARARNLRNSPRRILIYSCSSRAQRSVKNALPIKKREAVFRLIIHSFIPYFQFSFGARSLCDFTFACTHFAYIYIVPRPAARSGELVF